MITPLPTVEGGFGTVIADIAWLFDNKASRGAAEDHYEAMPTWEAMFLPVRDVVAEKAHLYLWTTDGHLPFALSVFRTWGFDYKLTLTWVKTTRTGKLKIGLGNYFRHAHELCLFGTRGKAPAKVHDLPTVFWGERTAHSRKPDVLHEWAEKLSPGPYLELFARRNRPGWTSWGNELTEPNALEGPDEETAP